ncbi:MAG TPA: thiamine-phosphate kinase [Bacteroidales bacterium]|nr:thiamine-phosphate kinase [Bacteroidales bacterium]HPT03127.1 thiamine-phosphate kinase [Bacteroidales bacterium]
MISDPNPERTELSELGEFGLIDRLTENISLLNPSTLKGVGDDAAVIDNQNKLTLVSTDLLIEGIHFDLTFTPLKHLGYKSAVVNFSDIYAMNGSPKQLFVGISVSNRFSAEALDELYSGIKLACKHYHVDLAGGDTTSSPQGLFLALTVTGVADKNKVVYRNTAKPNDLICVSGDLGGAYMGLLLLEREKQVFLANPDMQPDLQGHDYIIGRQLKPEARKDIIESLDKAGILPTSMIDISDGLASEIMHICKGSKAGCRIYEEKIPIDAMTVMTAEEFNISPVTAAMNGGEEYELLFTVRMEDYEKIREIEGITVIGHITGAEEGCNLVTGDNVLVEIKAQGFDHMKEKE